MRAAAHEFALRGFDGATTIAIAQRAGVTQPLVHHHFGSKADLWSSVLTDLFGTLGIALSAANVPVSGETARARIERLIRSVILYGAKRPELARLLRLESASGGSSFEVLYSQHLEPLLRFFDKTLDEAERVGVVRRLDRGFVYFATIGAAMQLFTEPVTARRAFAIDVADPHVAHAYADFVVGTMFAGLWETTAR